MEQKDFKRTRSNWMRPSLNPMGSRNSGAQEAHRSKAPWDQQSEELVEEFEERLKVMDTEVKHPWDNEIYELEQREQEKRKAANYKYESLFDTPPLTEKQQKAIDEYRMNPPYRCAYNYCPETQKSAKKLNPDKKPVTRKPWTHGQLPADPVAKKVHPRPSTALWDVPRGDQSAQPGKPLAQSGDPILDSLRAQLLAKGAIGISGLSRKFRIMDDSGDGKLDMNEFCKGIKECQIADLSDKALKHLFRYFDRDDSGTINYDEFLVGIRGVLNDRRKAIVQLAFEVLDADRSGAIDIRDLIGRYNASAHPDYRAGKRTEQEILQDFLLNFQVGREKDAVVTRQEFEEYYANLSASIDDDDYFELVIRNAWHISGGEGWCENSTNRRVLVRHADGRETVEELRNDIGISRKDTDKMVDKLRAQGVDVKTLHFDGRMDMHNQFEAKEKTPQLRANGRGGEEKQAGRAGGANPPATAATLATILGSENRSSKNNTLLRSGLSLTAKMGAGGGKPVSLGAAVRY